MCFARALAPILAALLVSPPAAAACDYPDEGTMPLHRAVTKVKLRPEVEAWAAQRVRERLQVQYGLLLDETHWLGGRCYWTVEVRAAGRLWRRYYVTPDGRRVVSEAARETRNRPRAAVR
jgi:hypothetical protein